MTTSYQRVSIAHPQGRPIIRLLAVLFGGIVLFTLAGHSLQAQSVTLKSDETRVIENFNWLPYAFASQSFGFGIGVGAAYSGWAEEETSILGAATVGTKGSYNLIGGLSDLRIPGTRRLYTDPLAIFGRYQEQYLFVGRNNPGFPNQRAGANDSDIDNRIEATQWDERIDLPFQFLLPIGHGAKEEDIVSRYVVKEGLLQSGASGGEAWNPLTSGKTYLHLTPQWREQTLENDELNVPLRTTNVEVGLEYNNFDFPLNPSKGSLQKVDFKNDFRDEDHLGGWEKWTAEYAKVFDLGPTDSFRQRILALDCWTAYIPTWETTTIDGREFVTERPPQFDSATLGGFYRMRAFEDDRFHDKAAIYYSLELRVIPTWQPLRGNDLLEFADISYWQWVPFIEVGQVAPSWNVSDLHSDLHIDGGLSLRGMLHKAVCRIDIAGGEEGARLTAMYGHPF